MSEARGWWNGNPEPGVGGGGVWPEAGKKVSQGGGP